MIISTYDPEHLHPSFGIDLGDVDLGPVEAFGVGAAFARVPPGRHSDPHQHDETETFVIFEGQGDIVVDNKRTPITAPMVVQFEPFETHYLDNTGDSDIFFTTFYWRDSPRAAKKAPRTDRRRFDERPIFVFSTPPTPNGGLHIGHLSGPYLGTDAFVRFQRMNGAEVYHLAATDDFQSYVAECARREGRTPTEVAHSYAAEIKETLAAMDIHPDQINHTSQEPGYQEALQAFFTRLVDSGLVTRQEGPALFDGESGQYLFEPYVDGGCPGCGNETGGNICEICGEPNFCVDLTDPQSAIGPATPRQGSVERYTLPLHELKADLLAHHAVGRAPAKVRELANRVFAREQLNMALTHPSDWGVRPVQDDVPGQVIWVWIELGFGFIYGIETLGRKLGRDWRVADPQDNWKIVHFLGYDNTFYHSIFSPALYKIANPGWTPDIDYNVNEFYLLDGDKFSTSRRHVIWGKDILTPDNVDAIRFYLSLTRPETRRTNFTLKDFEAVVSNDLVGRWQRWLDDLGARVERHYGGVVRDAGIWTPEHTAFLSLLQTWLGVSSNALGQDGFSLNRAAAALDGLVADTLRFSEFESKTADLPDWADETRTAIALELAAAKLLAHIAAPVMPRFAAKLAAALGLDEPTQWPELVTLIPPGTKIKLAGQVFFQDPVPTSADADLLPWLTGVVDEALAGEGDGELDPESTLVALGLNSMQAIALQYQILQRTGADIAIEDLLGDRTLAELAELLEKAEQATGNVPASNATNHAEVVV
ncbi:MAG TPA: class I tRNA ligase family protein [Streptosporangiaceae bacterium]|nr:class I tRNA ligase family protein [Streptosporangiaceae bacterium]